MSIPKQFPPKILGNSQQCSQIELDGNHDGSYRTFHNSKGNARFTAFRWVELSNGEHAIFNSYEDRSNPQNPFDGQMKHRYDITILDSQNNYKCAKVLFEEPWHQINAPYHYPKSYISDFSLKEVWETGWAIAFKITEWDHVSTFVYYPYNSQITQEKSD